MSISLASAVVDDIFTIPVDGEIRVHGYDCRDARRDAKTAGIDERNMDQFMPDGETTLADAYEIYRFAGVVDTPDRFLAILNVLPCAEKCLEDPS